jgi:hypothetical protein
MFSQYFEAEDCERITEILKKPYICANCLQKGLLLVHSSPTFGLDCIKKLLNLPWAVARMPASNLTPLTFGNAEDARVFIENDIVIIDATNPKDKMHSMLLKRLIERDEFVYENEEIKPTALVVIVASSMPIFIKNYNVPLISFEK